MNDERDKMQHMKRLTYALAVTVLIFMVTMLVSAWLSPEFMVKMVTDHYWVGIFGIAYLIAPWLSRFLKEK